VFTPSGEGQDMDSWESSSFYLLGGLEHEFYNFPETVGNFIIEFDFSIQLGISLFFFSRNSWEWKIIPTDELTP